MAVRAGKYTLNVQQGSTHNEHFEFADGDGDPLDLSGCTARAQIRYGFDGALVCEMTSANEKLEVDETNGYIDMSIPDTETAAFPTGEALRWDLEVVYDSGEVFRYLEGPVVVHAEVTK